MSRTLSAFGICFMILLAASPQRTGQAAEKERTGFDSKVMAPVQVEFFEAVDAKSIEVSFVPSDATRAKITVRNLSGKPLKISLPATFVGVPVLGQFANPLGQGVGFPGVGNGQLGVGAAGMPFGAGGPGGGGSQALGGGFPQGQLGVGGPGNGIGPQVGPGRFNGFGNGAGNVGVGGFFRIEPDRVRKIDVATVCLEHGKPNPNPRMKYAILPLDTHTKDLRIAALCVQLAEGKVTQNVAQAAAWNLANGLSWETLAGKDRKVSAYTGREKYFSTDEIRLAMRLVNLCSETGRYGTSNSMNDSFLKGDVADSGSNSR